MHYTRAKRLILESIKKAQSKGKYASWDDSCAITKDFSYSVYDLDRMFKQLYEAGKINTPDWWRDDIKVIERR